MATTTPDFSQPVFLSEDSHPATSFAGGEDISVESIDLNDPNLLSAELETNAEVDAYAAPPPLPDGRYRVKIKQVDVRGPNNDKVRYSVKQRKDKSGTPIAGDFYAFTSLQANVVAPGTQYDNYQLNDYFVSTMANRNGGIPIVRILTVLGVKLPAKTNAKILMDEFFKATAGEPELEIDTVWEGSLSQEDQERWKSASNKNFRSVLGMHRFPLAEDGKTRVPDLTVKTQEIGDVNLHARPRINGYFPLGSSKK